MASLTQWTWVSVNSGSWWGTGRPGVLRFMGSQRVGHDWATDLIWSEPSYLLKLCSASSSQTHEYLCLKESGFLSLCVYVFTGVCRCVVSGLVQCLSSISTHTSEMFLAFSLLVTIRLVQPRYHSLPHTKEGSWGNGEETYSWNLHLHLIDQSGVSCSTLIPREPGSVVDSGKEGEHWLKTDIEQVNLQSLTYPNFTSPPGEIFTVYYLGYIILEIKMPQCLVT